MAKRVILNQLAGKVQVLVTGTNETFTLTEFDDGGAGEVTSGLQISKIISSAAVTVYRGSNVVWQSIAGTGQALNLDALGMNVVVDSGATCNVHVAANETAIVEFKKKATHTNESVH